jgi:GxxExxY protein
MNADEHRLELDRITKKIIGCVYRVSNTLGCGFLEKVYKNALVIDLRYAKLRLDRQHPVTVFYNDLPVGEFAIDLLVESCVIVELKAAKTLDEVHFPQCLNYLRASGLNVRLPVNFGTSRAQIKRIVSNH